MIDRDAALKSVPKSEDKLLIAKICDKLVKAQRSNSIVLTEFLDPRQRILADNILQKFNLENLEYIFSGGYDGAEREVLFFRPEFISPEEFEENMLDAFKVISIKLNSHTILSHRDYLGSLMALGIKREKTGDIVLNDNGAFIIVLSDIAEYISSNIFKIGNVGITTDIVGLEGISAIENSSKEIKATVASLRVDSVASIGFGMSRTKVAELIRAEKLNLNWEVCSNTTKMVKQGDVLSIRGKGRIVLTKIGGNTKKDRIFIEVNRHI